ncbi:GL19208 [Drosophila persimilis]|uniref:GL19208 n=2 Tax=Drosophila persimilis TaxID=7234 RepID=B4G7X3_DROPE|nr:pickpocket protein 11 isoform X1 [Drosophila persimilis]EDW28471.1 GL19208 [Drosophila persimilis]
MSAFKIEETPPPLYTVYFEDYLRPKKLQTKAHLQHFEKKVGKISAVASSLKRLKILRWHSRIIQRFQQLPLPSFLSFLRARKDDGMCKRKSGFEIYCEMASIHGFHVFVGAETWQRIFWWLLICTAVILSNVILLTAPKEAPTILFIDSMMKATSEIPFPAVTICSLNGISKDKLQKRAKEWKVSEETLRNSVMEELFRTNLSWSQLLEDLAPPICEQIRSCKWENHLESCLGELKPFWTFDHRLCCSFNHQKELYSSQLGVSLVVNLQKEDYADPIIASHGLEVLIHESQSVPDAATMRMMIPSDSETHLMVRAFSTRFTANLAGLPIEDRRCFLPDEHRLWFYSAYSLSNCLSECRSKKIFQSCGCVPPHAPGESTWPICGLQQVECVRKYDEISEQITAVERDCNCLPPCTFHRYEFESDVDAMRGSNSTNEVYLNVYYDLAFTEELLLDVYETWLAFIGTFGGVNGLFMGCSFVSVFELIFFTCVRPTCNWLARQQILWRRRRKQAKVGLAH